MSAVRGAAREPSLALALVFGLVTLEIAFAMLTVLLSQLGLGGLAWVRIFGGSLVGVAIAVFFLPAGIRSPRDCGTLIGLIGRTASAPARCR